MATTRISSSVSELTCLHIDEINDGSYDPPAAPSPTPVAYNVTTSATPSSTAAARVSSNQSITGGTIAGAVVGSVAGVAAIVSGLLFCIWRKRKAQNITADTQEAVIQHETNGGKAELPGESNRFELEGPKPRELEGKDSRHQLPATEQEGGRDNRQWLDGTEIQKEKLEDQEPVELP